MEDVPEDTSEWNPEIAPHATVTKSVGNIYVFAPASLVNTKPLNAFNFISGCPVNTPTTPPMIIPRNMNVVI